jgi:hypothetical protein
MPMSGIEEFAKLLIEKVRDAAVQSCDRNLRPDAQHIIAERWREAARVGVTETFAKVIIPDIVDESMFYLFEAIDQGLLQISFKASDGKTINLTNEGLGELSGWYAGRYWLEKYSTERFAKNFPGIGPK